MSKIPWLTLALVLLCVLSGLRLVNGSTSTTYSPALTPGEWSEYLVGYNCGPSNSSFCLGFQGFNNTAYFIAKVVSVFGTNVTFTLLKVSGGHGWVRSPGTGSIGEFWVDVDSGEWGLTALGFPFQFVLASNLQVNDTIWNDPNGRSIFDTVVSATTSEMVLGYSRNVNLVRITGDNGCLECDYVRGTLNFDQQSGIIIQARESISDAFGRGTAELGISMIDSNIWRSSEMPDFQVNASPTTIVAEPFSHAVSVVTIRRTNLFSATVNLTAVPSSSKVTCALSNQTLVYGSADTSDLSCTGPPGSYTVAVKADAGYSHTTLITINLVSGPTVPMNSAAGVASLWVSVGSGLAGLGLLLGGVALLLSNSRSVNEKMPEQST